MSTSILPDGSYRIIGPRFACGVVVARGRVDVNETAPILRRLGGMDSNAFAFYAKGRGWKVEPVKRVEASRFY